MTGEKAALTGADVVRTVAVTLLLGVVSLGLLGLWIVGSGLGALVQVAAGGNGAAPSDGVAVGVVAGVFVAELLLSLLGTTLLTAAPRRSLARRLAIAVTVALWGLSALGVALLDRSQAAERERLRTQRSALEAAERARLAAAQRADEASAAEAAKAIEAKRQQDDEEVRRRVEEALEKARKSRPR